MPVVNAVSRTIIDDGYFDANHDLLVEPLAMATITVLSNELIDAILRQENVSIQDVVNFGLTCTRFLAVIDDNNLLWQRKLYQR